MPHHGVHILALRKAHGGDTLSIHLLHWSLPHTSSVASLVSLVRLLYSIAGSVGRGTHLGSWKEHGESQVVDSPTKQVDVVEPVKVHRLERGKTVIRDMESGR